MTLKNQIAKIIKDNLMWCLNNQCIGKNTRLSRLFKSDINEAAGQIEYLIAQRANDALNSKR